MTEASPAFWRHWSIGTALTWGFALLVAVAVSTVLYFGWRSAERNTIDLIALNAEIIVATVDRRVQEYLAPAREESEYLAGLIGSGDLDPADTAQIRRHLMAAVATNPQLAGAVYLDEDLRAIDVDRTPDGLVVDIADWSGDPDVQSAKLQMGRAERGFWGEVVYLEDLRDVVINYRAPVRRRSELIGAVMATVGTRQLSEYLESIAASSNVVPFILVGQEDVLTYAGSSYERERRSKDAPSLELTGVGDTVLRQMWDESKRVTIPGAPVKPPFQARLLELKEGRFLFVYQYVYGIGPLPWIVGCYFRGESFAGYVERVRHVVIAGLIVLALGVVSVFVVGRRIAAPVRQLASAANRVRRRGPADTPALPPSRLREIDQASTAFNEMVEGLRDRELMRETFGKYVPDSIVDEILADRGVLAPQKRLTTTLFTDIVGFSTVSESMDPEALIGLLNEYFAALIEPIERHGGVIHQFQGDAILATYNLPVMDPEHAVHAVRTALDIQDAVRERRFGEGVVLATRVGINTGTAVCGTVGSGGRLGFTVHGDDVNLAARIEQMNKEIGTRILVAESTMHLAGDRFEFRRVGELPVRGRKRDVVVYRVVGPHNTEESVET